MIRILVILTALVLSGCQTMGEREGVGTLAGAGLGGLVGSHIGSGDGRIIATTVGIMFGGLIGREIGAQLDRADKARHAQVFHTALEHRRSGSVERWHNPNTGAQGHVIPQRTYALPGGMYCREYQSSISVGGKSQRGYGKACRQPDGSWQIQ